MIAARGFGALIVLVFAWMLFIPPRAQANSHQSPPIKKQPRGVVLSPVVGGQPKTFPADSGSPKAQSRQLIPGTKTLVPVIGAQSTLGPKGPGTRALVPGTITKEKDTINFGTQTPIALTPGTPFVPSVPGTPNTPGTSGSTSGSTGGGGGGGGGGSGAVPGMPGSPGTTASGGHGYGPDTPCVDCPQRRQENEEAKAVRQASADRAKALMVDEPLSTLSIQKEEKKPLGIGRLGDLIRKWRKRNADRDAEIEKEVNECRA
jgi:hypothetical protein